MLSPESGTAEISCSGWKKLCPAIQFLTHLSDYRLSHFALFFPVQLLSWQSRTIAWNTYRNNTNSQSSSLRGRRQPYLEMPCVWRLQRAPKEHKGRAGSWTHLSHRSAFFKPECSFPSHNISPASVEFQLPSVLQAQADCVGLSLVPVLYCTPQL